MAQEFFGIRADSKVDALSIAAANSMLKELKLLLNDGVDVNGIAEYCGGTALHTAARLGVFRPVEVLLSSGADLDLIDRDQMTALMRACSGGKVKGGRIAMRLIEAGADVRYVRAADGMTALKFAARSCAAEIVQALIDRGAEVDGPPGSALTPLMFAARNNNVPALEVLVKNGADLSIPCPLGWAGGRTAEGLAELVKQRAAHAYLRKVRCG
jgi:ankyrin repeat protein